jgi:hypothetical protein
MKEHVDAEHCLVPLLGALGVVSLQASSRIKPNHEQVDMERTQPLHPARDKQTTGPDNSTLFFLELTTAGGHNCPHCSGTTQHVHAIGCTSVIIV